MRRGLAVALVGMLLTGVTMGPAIAGANAGTSTAIHAYVARQGTFTVVDTNTISVKANAPWRLVMEVPGGSVVRVGSRTSGTIVEVPTDARSVSLVIQ